jgi:hypothetical protein
MRVKLPIENPDELLKKVTDKLAQVHNQLEKAEQITDIPKPKTLAEKIQAAGEKVKTQHEQSNNPKSGKRDERE